MKYYVAVVGHDKGITVHAEFVRQGELADVVDRHVRTSHTEQIRHAPLMVAIRLAVEYGRTDRGQQPVLLPSGGVEGGRVLLNVFVLVQLRRDHCEDNGERNNE